MTVADHEMREVLAASAWLPVTEDMLVDAGIDVPGYEERIAAERAKRDAMWRALPWYVRMQRTVRMWRWHTTAAAREWLHSRLFPDCEGEG
jgi:hypothetical protein